MKRRSFLFLRIGLISFVLASLLLIGLGPAVPSVQAAAPANTFVNEKIDPALAAKLHSTGSLVPLEVVIVFSDPSAAARVRPFATKFFAMQALPMAGAVLTAGQINELAGWPEIYSITLNEQLEYFLHESVPLIKADQVWHTYGQTGGNVTVAVIDTGIDATHVDLPLGSKVIQNVKVLPFEPSLENQPMTDTTSGHGTHVAGTIGGNGTASGGYYLGVAPGVKIVGLGAGETIGILTAVQAYDYVLQHHDEYDIRVVSNSWGSTGGQINLRNPVVVATFEAYKQGILSVFAAGNDGGYDVMNPYSLAPWLLSVAAGKKDGSLAEFSSRGKDGDYFKHPDITAPGVDIYATRAKLGADTAPDVLPNPVNPLWTPFYTVLSGTSMATPHVSGAAALLFSANPELSPDQVIDLLTANATPMPGYMFHESGYGYMDVLAAYEESRTITGNLHSFVAGNRLHSEEEVVGFNPDDPVPYDEYLYTGFTPIASNEAPLPIDHAFDVGEGTLYVSIGVTWTPQLEDAYDVEVLDPQGRVVVSSGNGLNSGEMMLFVPEAPGTYILRLHPFAAVATSYEARVKVAYGESPGGPPNGEPVYDYYLGVVGVYKLYGAVGIISDNFRSGDGLFIVFTLTSADGTPVTAQAANLRAIYTDRLGNTAFVDNAITERSTSGEYESFLTIDNQWAGVPGPVTVNFTYNEGGTLRALPTGFKLNNLGVTLNTNATRYRPGDRISFNGNVKQLNDVLTGGTETTPLSGAAVTIRLLDSNGSQLASTQAVTNLQGNFSGSIVAPASTRGTTTLVAEATYNDVTIALGPTGWYGKAEKRLSFPGNLPPQVSLSAPSQTDESTKFFIHIEASASDPDGAADISSLTLVLSDSKGRQLKRWTQVDFTRLDANTWRFDQGYKVSGKAPWTLTLSATDSAGNTATTSALIQR
jgi:serine protease AprX